MADSNSLLSEVPESSLLASGVRLILASGSVARQALLKASGLPFAVCPAQVEEGPVRDHGKASRQSAQTVALELAQAKALAVSGDHPGALVIGADQMLSCDGVWFEKPLTYAAARGQLVALRGRTHHLHSAVVLCRDGHILWRHVSTPTLTMRHFSDAVMETCLAADGGACLHCVGSYRLEGPGIQFFERIEGTHDALLGLPMLPLLAALRDMEMLRK
ncbi:septum formation inhibitor nucleotide-binding protein Maf [Acetobacter estunensis NRIC 0472]|nr:septum formation inhibitor nucleotide-binding protein Maf [Acetobacter estunensis NRIC 0472]